MKKLALWFTFFIFATAAAHAQNRQLIIKKNDNGFYVDHTVAPKEGLYSIGRTYNIHPRTIASFNNIDMNAGLNIGQVIHIPLNDTNFSQKTNKGTPIYYTVKEREGLLTVSNQNNNVTMQSIRDWNNLKSDKLNVGSKLIVGYLVTEPVSNPNPVREEVKPVEKEEVGKSVEQPAIEPAIKKDEVAIQPETKKEESAQAAVSQGTANVTGQGFFRTSFEQQAKATPLTKSETVTSGIFKTVSGWQDAKYYLLMDKVQSGTIVRLTNPDNNKTVYAKVLGEMNGIRQNQGLDIRISNAAAAALEVSDLEKFILKINY